MPAIQLNMNCTLRNFIPKPYLTDAELKKEIQTFERVIHSTWDKEVQLNKLKSDLRILETKITAMIKNVPAEKMEEKKVNYQKKEKDVQYFE